MQAHSFGKNERWVSQRQQSLARIQRLPLGCPPEMQKIKARRCRPRLANGARPLPGVEGIDFLHEIGSRIAASDPFHTVLQRIVDFVLAVIPCDSCFIYVLDARSSSCADPRTHADLVACRREFVTALERLESALALNRHKNCPSGVLALLTFSLRQATSRSSGHSAGPRSDWMGRKTSRTCGHPVKEAMHDPRFKMFKDLPEDYFETLLSIPILCASKVCPGVINLQHRQPYYHKPEEVRLLSMIRLSRRRRDRTSAARRRKPAASRSARR